jgi:hypothetical protein
MKSEKMFDTQIKSALENIEVPYDPSTWSMLEQKLGPAPDQPHPVDSVVSDALSKMEVPFSPMHWEEMSDQLFELQRTRRRIRLSKFLEAAIFLLLLANIEGFTGSLFDSKPAHKPVQSLEPVADSDVHGRDKKSGNHHKYTAVPAAFGGVNSSFPEDQATAISGQGAGLIPAIQGTVTPEMAEGIHSVNAVTAISLPRFETFDPIAGLNGNSPLNFSEKINQPHQIIVKLPKERRFYVALNAGFDKNTIRSNSDARSANGYAAGMTAGYRTGKWGFETGVVYDKKEYQPKKVIEIYDHNSNGYFGTYASNVKADMVSIPLKGLRQVARSGKMKVYAVAGLTAHVVLRKNFQYNNVFYPAPSASPTTTDPAPQPQMQQVGKGLLQRGNLEGNVYASADAGVRIERKIGKRTTLFVEPCYQTSLGGGKGIGPVAGRINTMTIQAGVMASL